MSVRIKTNGSLPKEKRPQEFYNGLNGHNGHNGVKANPETLFSFESTYGSGKYCKQTAEKF